MSVDVSQETNLINTAINGKDVRGSLANGITKIADEVNSFEGDIDNRQNSVETRQTNLENTFTAEIENAISENPSSAETVGSRTDNVNNITYDTLGARLDNQASQLAEVMNNGKVLLPSQFPELPFNVYRIRKGKYITDATPNNQFDWSSAEELFISCDGATSGTGRSANNPININAFTANISVGNVYTGTKFILNIMDVICAGDNILDINGIDILIRSRSIIGFSWISRLKRPVSTEISNTWSIENGIFKCTQYVAHKVIDVVNINDLSEMGEMPKPYIKVNSLAECQATKGTFYQTETDADVYCNPYEGHKIEQCMLLVSTKKTQISTTSSNTIIFENIGFCAGSTFFTPNNQDSQIYFFNCKFFRNFNDAISITGKYNAYMINCVASYASKDGFNYHSDTKDSLAVEVNCIAYGSGKYKLENGNTDTGSNNGSTAHDGMNVIRFGTKAWDCEGSIIADVNNCSSISFECETGSVLETCTGVRAGFQFYDGGPILVNKYVVGCKTRNINNAVGISGTAKTIEIGMKGNRLFDGGIISKNNYEEVL